MSDTAPYGSARDLPSYQDLANQLQGFKLLTRLIARDRRAELLTVERELNALVDVVDRFYERLGSRNWIFHELLSVPKITGILDSTEDPEAAERALIELYQDPESTRYLTLRLMSIDGLRERAHQIERAREHYVARHFDSCTLHLIAVMDGFVNDFEPANRTGLTSRDTDQMTAWDSVVGHHLGLTHALKTFQTTIKKRRDDEVFELYRHGIVHGTITRFDNDVVATKAWNMLFAVADWAKATEKSRVVPTAAPSLRETLGQIVNNGRVKAELDAWSAATLVRGDAGFDDSEIYALTDLFLRSWAAGNYGALVDLSSRQSLRDKNRAHAAGETRHLFHGLTLSAYEITDLEHTAPAIWLASGGATVNDRRGRFECRWLIETEDGDIGFGKPNAAWRLVNCSPTVWRAIE